MAIQRWHVVAAIPCGHAAEATLLEQRIYPADFLEDATGAFQVVAQTCDHAEICRENGFSCRWTGINPNYDPFAA